MIRTFIIDLFCGAGGTTTAVYESNTNMEVVMCINHDETAILSHKANYPNCIHLTEDIRTVAMSPIVKLVNNLRNEYPGCKIALWASLECTNYSKAKGGQPRDADSRSLADHLFRYMDHIDPDFIWIENVREFMAWEPLDACGKPKSKERGKDYMRWVNSVKSYGYYFDFRLLNSANFGGYTIRTRYFAQFSKNREMIAFPAATHSKEPAPASNLFEHPLKKWRPVRDVLDLSDEGDSIFRRKKPLSDNTLRRIYAGLIKFVANGDDSFIKKYFSGDPSGKVISADGPCGTITTIDHHALVKCVFLSSYYGTGGPKNIDSPCRTITTKDRFAKVEAHFLNNYYSSGSHNSSIETPMGSILPNPKQRLASINFMDEQYGNSTAKSLDEPNGTLPQNPKHNLISVTPWLVNMNSSTAPPKDIDNPAPTITSQRTHVMITPEPWLMDTNFNNIGSDIDAPAPTVLASRHHHYLMNPSWGGHNTSIDSPSQTIIARMDKAPISLITTTCGAYGIVVYEHDSDIMQEIKRFMAAYGIMDIKMRMLKIPELLPIQGFPKDYKLKGTRTEQKKFIGNSVEVTVGKALFSAIDTAIQAHVSGAMTG